ncbi:hypothetical protein [Methylomicrobium agile]|nr:hypothetical protein [Methylomicrobium agile]
MQPTYRDFRRFDPLDRLLSVTETPYRQLDALRTLFEKPGRTDIHVCPA